MQLSASRYDNPSRQADDAVLWNPRRSNLVDDVAGDPKASPLGVVAKAVFDDDMFGIPRPQQDGRQCSDTELIAGVAILAVNMPQ
jgi:hypothetical protein